MFFLQTIHLFKSNRRNHLQWSVLMDGGRDRTMIEKYTDYCNLTLYFYSYIRIIV